MEDFCRWKRKRSFCKAEQSPRITLERPNNSEKASPSVIQHLVALSQKADQTGTMFVLVGGNTSTCEPPVQSGSAVMFTEMVVCSDGRSPGVHGLSISQWGGVWRCPATLATCIDSPAGTALAKFTAHVAKSAPAAGVQVPSMGRLKRGEKIVVGVLLLR